MIIVLQRIAPFLCLGDLPLVGRLPRFLFGNFGNIFSHKKEEVKSSDCLAFYISAQCDSTVGRKS